MRKTRRAGIGVGVVLLATLLWAGYACKPQRAEKPAPSSPDQVTSPDHAASPDHAKAPDTGADKNTAAPAVPDHAAAARTDEARITLVYTGSVNGEVWDCGCPGHPRGGISPRSAWVRGLRDSGMPVVYLDAGNGFFRLAPRAAPSEMERKQAEVLSRGLVRLQTAAVNVGPQDLRGGLSHLRDTLAKAGGDGAVPLISANVAGKDGMLLFPASKTVREGGVTVSIFGLMGTDAEGGDSVSVRDPLEAAKNMVSELRPGCELLVGLFAMDYSDAARLAKEAPGVDVIIVSSRASTVKTRPMVVGDSLVCQAGNRGMYVGRMEITFKGAGGSEMSREEHAKLKGELARLTAQQAALEGEALKDPAVRAEYNKTLAAQNELHKKLAASSDWNYEHSVVSMDPDLPQDETVLEWIKEAGIPPKPEHH